MMKTLTLLITAIALFGTQLVYASAPDTIIINESTAPDWASGTIDSLSVSTDTLTLDTVRTFHFNFTNCGMTGQFGPSQSNINSAYAGTDLNGAVTVVTPGIQQWITPEAGVYRIAA